MKLVLRLVETGIDGSSRSIDVLEIVGRSDPGDIAALGVTLSQGKQLLALIQQEVVAAQCRGFWRMSGHPAVQQALRNHDFDSLDSMSLPKFNPVEPPWYGPVCPVVWEGRHREVSPYPDQPQQAVGYGALLVYGGASRQVSLLISTKLPSGSRR